MIFTVTTRCLFGQCRGISRQLLVIVLCSIGLAVCLNCEEVIAGTMTERVKFTSGGDSIEGVFYSANQPEYTVLLLHGFPGSPDDVLGLGEGLASSGINVMTFNYRGTCTSEGTSSLANSQQDIAEAWQFLHLAENIEKYSIDTASLVLGGYSFGGGMALTYAANHNHVTRVFSIAGTDHGEFARRYKSDSSFARLINDMFRQLEAPQGPVRFVGKAVLEELQVNASKYDLRMVVPQLCDKDLLLIGGLDDMNVSLEEHLLPLYRALRKSDARSVQFEIVQDNHGFSQVREELRWIIDRWIRRSEK